MHLNKLTLSNFKNISQEEFSFCKNVNCFVGENGAGKTNILDAIYYLSLCKSYFSNIDANNIKHESDFFSIHGLYDMDENGNIEKYSCVVQRGVKKIFKLDDNPYTKLAQHICKIPLVIITPSDQELIIGQSFIRRKFVDIVLSQAIPLYVQNLSDYNRALQQRNICLKKCNSTSLSDLETIKLLDEQLISLGKEVHIARKKFINEFSSIVQYYYNYISSEKEQVRLQYQSQDLENNFRNLLLESRERDIFLGYTTIGVHKDDLLLKMNQYEVKKYASQGQQKSFLIALKLAQFEYLFKKTKLKPILLLDDIFDKLDLSRIKQLMSLVGSDRFGQVFLTDTQIERIKEIFLNQDVEHRIYKISNGRMEI